MSPAGIDGPARKIFPSVEYLHVPGNLGIIKMTHHQILFVVAWWQYAGKAIGRPTHFILIQVEVVTIKVGIVVVVLVFMIVVISITTAKNGSRGRRERWWRSMSG